jgi:hypothetical protein
MGFDELGLGPYHGSYFDLTVRDGEIVHATGNVEISTSSYQTWAPFDVWINANHAADADVMYVPSGNAARYSEESFRLWEPHIESTSPPGPPLRVDQWVGFYLRDGSTPRSHLPRRSCRRDVQPTSHLFDMNEGWGDGVGRWGGEMG